MAIKTYRPTTQTLRYRTNLASDDITTTKPYKLLVEPKLRTGGRRNSGDTTMRFIGGGHKRKLRIIDFKRDKIGIPATVSAIEYDPNRSARIALLSYADGEKRYILQPDGLKVGQKVVSGPEADILVGNALPLRNIPPGTTIHNVELKPGKGAQMVRSAGGSAVGGEGRRLRAGQAALGRNPQSGPGLHGDHRPGGQPRPREYNDWEGRPNPLAGQAPAQPRRFHESGGSPARWRRGQDFRRAPSGDAVGPADTWLQDA